MKRVIDEADIDAVKQQIISLRQAELAVLTNYVQSLRTDLGGVKTDLVAAVQGLNAKLNTVQTDLTAIKKKVGL